MTHKIIHPNYLFIEWPTFIVLVLTYLSFITLTVFYHSLPTWLVLPAAGYTLALYGSLQHEHLHGHPTRQEWVNSLLVYLPLSLWLPYPLYKQSHLLHHNNPKLTEPSTDPESYYLTPQYWKKLPQIFKYYYIFLNTIAGRLFLGPLHVVTAFFYREITLLLSGNFKHIKTWILHALSGLFVLYWLMVVCEITFVEYLVLFIYPGLSLTLLRSFLEHQSATQPEHRSVIVESNPVMSLLFLNNNLHAIHHDYPQLAWYQLPAQWKQNRGAILQRNNGYFYSGYSTIIWQFLFKAKETPQHHLSKKHSNNR